MTDHTPGPWDYELEAEGRYWVIKEDGGEEEIARVRIKEDAALIASAPELLVKSAQLSIGSGELLRQVKIEREYNQRLREALEKIACPHVTRDQLWWQNEARRALEGGE